MNCTNSGVLAIALLLAACADPPQRATAAGTPPPTPEMFADFSSRSVYFYLAPSRESFDTLQQEAEALRGQIAAKSPDGEEVAAVMIARISQHNGWPVADGTLGSEARNLIAGQTPMARYIDNDNQVDAPKLDFWWGSFFATGDERYLESILRYAGEEPPKNNLNQALIDGVAGWSFKANCAQHRKVLDFARRKLASPGVSDYQASYLQSCLAFAEAHPERAR